MKTKEQPNEDKTSDFCSTKLFKNRIQYMCMVLNDTCIKAFNANGILIGVGVWFV